MTVLDVARALPDIPSLRARCRALAMLDAIMSPEWDSRYYSFDAHWAPDEQMASMRNGSGDEWSIVFSPAGAFIRGFDHESPMSPFVNDGRLWPGLVDTVPPVFARHVAEPAFSYQDKLLATVCLWRRPDDDRWHTGDIEFPDDEEKDGADFLFDVLVEGTAAAYRDFAENYYEEPVDPGAAEAILALRPLSTDLVRRLNPELAAADLAEDVTQIGYPSALPA